VEKKLREKENYENRKRKIRRIEERKQVEILRIELRARRLLERPLHKWKNP
jgi:hypothetical protein